MSTSMRRGWNAWLLPVACAAASLLPPAQVCPAAVEIRLAEAGNARQKVVVAPNSSPQVRAVAGQLATYLGRIAGAEFSVAKGDGTGGIAVGLSRDFPALATGVAFEPADPFRREEYLLRTHARGVWLLGATEPAVEHAVWDFLHRLGYRLFFPTDTWEVVPNTPDLRLALDVVEKPAFITRQAPRGAPWSNSALWSRWLVRNRITAAFTLHTGHSYDGILRANRQAFAEHPEYLALVDGERRGSKFCISNPGLRKLVVNHAVRAMRADPQLDSVSLDPSDGGGWCECASCAAMGGISDRAVTLANDVAEAINRLGLGPKYVGIYAYNQHSPPPAVKVHPKVVVSVATSFIRGGYSVEQLIEGWAARNAVLGIREYHDVFPWSHDMPRRARGGDISYLARTIPYFYESGARFMNSENSDSWGANGLGYWLSPILLWDVADAKRVDHHVQDFLEKAFGPARAPMRDFYHLLSLDRSMRTPEDVVGRMYRSLAAARPLAGTPAVSARLDDLVLYTRYAELYNRYRPASGAARQAAFERLWRHTYRIRDRMLVSTVAICHRDRFRDRSVNLPESCDWEVPEGKNPWKSSAPFTAAELARMVDEGIAANPIMTLDFEPVDFSRELVRAAPLKLPEASPGSFSLRGRGTRRYLIWLDKPGQLVLRVTGGLIAHYRDRGNVKISLFSPQEATLEPVAHDESVPPDGNEHQVALKTPYGGLHTLEVSDGSDMTDLVLRAGLPVTIESAMPTPPPDLGRRWTLYFYVPRGTRVVGGYTSDTIGILRDGSGAQVFDFGGLGRAGYFRVPVPHGQDGRLWKLENAGGQKLLMTVPPYLARSEKELLLPREVVAADGPLTSPPRSRPRSPRPARRPGA